VNDSTLFIVHVWLRREAFHATVRRVDDEQARLFKSAAEVGRYLEETTRPPQPAADPARKSP
jgi:hypothetical protein